MTMVMMHCRLAVVINCYQLFGRLAIIVIVIVIKHCLVGWQLLSIVINYLVGWQCYQLLLILIIVVW